MFILMKITGNGGVRIFFPPNICWAEVQNRNQTLYIVPGSELGQKRRKYWEVNCDSLGQNSLIMATVQLEGTLEVQGFLPLELFMWWLNYLTTKVSSHIIFYLSHNPGKTVNKKKQSKEFCGEAVGSVVMGQRRSCHFLYPPLQNRVIKQVSRANSSTEWI